MKRYSEMILNLTKNRQQEFRFLLIGGINTIFGISIFPFLYYIFSPLRVGYIVIFILSFFFATLFSFCTNKYIVFRTSGDVLSEYLKFMSFQSFHFLINIIFLPLVVETFKFTPLFVQPAFVVLVVITSYFWYSKKTFIR
jgi:putative flippase GtrA